MFHRGRLGIEEALEAIGQVAGVAPQPGLPEAGRQHPPDHVGFLARTGAIGDIDLPAAPQPPDRGLHLGWRLTEPMGDQFRAERALGSAGLNPAADLQEDRVVEAVVEVGQNPPPIRPAGLACQGGEAAARRLEVGLRGLSSLGLIESGSLSNDDRLVVVHPMIADSNRAHLVHPQADDPEPGRVRQAAVALLQRRIRALEVARPADWPRYRLLTPHVQALMGEAAAGLDQEHLVSLVDVAGWLAAAHDWMGVPFTAEELTDAALAVGARLDADHPALLDVRGLAAHQAGLQGRWGEAEAAYREVLKARQRVQGDDHHSTLATRHELGRAMARQERCGEAEAAYRELLKAKQRVLGDDHPSTLATGNELIRSVANQGRWREAEAAFPALLEARRRVLGADHPETLTTRHELAIAVANQGRWEEAEAAFREILEARRRVQGDDNPDTLATRHSLARAMARQERWGEAEAAFREVLETRRRVLGADHPATLSTSGWIDECVRRQRSNPPGDE